MDFFWEKTENEGYNSVLWQKDLRELSQRNYSEDTPNGQRREYLQCKIFGNYTLTIRKGKA
jgi:hypothetical protein